MSLSEHEDWYVISSHEKIAVVIIVTIFKFYCYNTWSLFLQVHSLRDKNLHSLDQALFLFQNFPWQAMHSL